MKDLVSSSPDIVKKVGAVFLWNITKDGKTVAKWSELGGGGGGGGGELELE